MLIDASELAPQSKLDCEICVIGAGPAGISLAVTLADSGRQVLLVEGGLLGPSRDHQDLYKGKVKGPLQEDYLHRSRLRQFGGTTGHWNGLCAELEPIDFSKRAWVPHSGWPIGYEDLAAYYQDARRWLKIDHMDRVEKPAIGEPFNTSPLRHVS